jgi:protein-disulfide isomerase
MTAAEDAAFGAKVRAYLLENPNVIMEAVAILQEQDAAQAAQSDQDLLIANAAALYESPHDLILGNPEGDITMVEFLDYRCGYCKKAHPEVNALLETDGNIKLIVKEFPILGEASVLASRFALATKLVEGDEAYALVHEMLMGEGNNITEGSLKRMVRGMDLDTDAITAHMDSEEVTQIIAQNHALGQAMGINGTPSFTIGTEMLRGYVPFDGMVSIVAAQRAG